MSFSIYRLMYQLFPRIMTRPSTQYVKDNLGDNLIVCEVGTFKGFNASNIVRVLNIKEIYLIDPYVAYDDGSGPAQKTQEEMDIIYQETKRKFFYFPAIFIRKFSDEALDDIPMVDFCYIDGNHTYEWVKKDIENYWPKVKKGGVIAGDDFRDNRLGLKKAVREFADKNNLKLNIKDTDWWIRK